MKRIYERVLFMVIGALIASFAYLVGNVDKGANADDLGEMIMCDTLYVTQRIVVGDPRKNVLLLSTNEEQPTIHMRLGNVDDPQGIIEIGVNEKSAGIAMESGGPDNPKGNIGIFASETGSGISITDKDGKKLLTTLD
ncbi:MAG: hypothetical protein OXI63_23090 [Candidatus Poribacteria bacterium]|nr:hypothetical protein [Candidatus Poribacteria bacterium]